MPLTLKYAKDDNPIDRFLELACLTYGGDRAERFDEAKLMLTADPSLGQKDSFTLACIGNAEQLEPKLESGSIDVNEKGGPMDWPMLLYACYSRVEAPGGSTLEVAKLLLKHGADPNAHFMWGGQYRFTALTGAFGEGEAGPKHQPPHPNWEALARLLLDAGADPNDSQALYNRMFTSGSRCLEMLIEYGLTPEAKNNWLDEKDGTLQPNSTPTLSYQLHWAIEKHHNDGVQLIIGTGIDVNQTLGNGATFLKLALLSGNSEAEQMLIAAGAKQPQLTLEEKFSAFVNRSNTAAAKELIAENVNRADELWSLLPQLLIDAAARNRTEVVQSTIDLDVDVNAVRKTTAMHQAAWSGHLDMVKFLLAAGADPTIKDPTHNATPADWGNHSGNQHIAEFLNGLD